MRKLQERLLSSIKLAEPELRDAYRDRYEELDATVIQLTPDMTAKVAPPNDADLARIYDQYKGRFSGPARSQLELLIQPKKFGDEEIRAARELAASLVNRARKGEDFAALARDYSDGPAADKGGEIPRPLSPTEFGPELAPQIAALQPGQISDPFQDSGRFVIIKYIEHVGPSATSPSGGMRVAQIVVRVRPNENSLRDQYQALQKLRDHAGSGGLGKAAAEAGLATVKTTYYDLSTMPQQLYTVPEAADWGISSKVGAVSPVFEGIDEFVVAQVSGKHLAGAPPREEITDRLRELADMDKRVTADKPRADAIAAELASGKTLEQAAKDKGVTPIVIKAMTRANPEPRMFAVPEMVGGMFAAPPGKVLGPLHGVNGWYFLRSDHRIAANPAMYDSLKGPLTSEILTRRQQNFFGGYLGGLRDKAKVQDLRAVDVSGN
jgi:peptidyl-prolyl cis-trans isomerase D